MMVLSLLQDVPIHMPIITMPVPMRMMEVAGYPDNGSYALSFDGVDDYTSLDWSDQLSTYTVSMCGLFPTPCNKQISMHSLALITLIVLDFNWIQIMVIAYECSLLILA